MIIDSPHQLYFNNPTKFVENVIFHLRNEKDPRNLVIMLSIYSKMLYKISEEVILTFRDDIFENISVYFPITFTNTRRGVNMIGGDLIDIHNQCLCYHLFLEDTVELIFEKIGENDVKSRVSAIKTLNQIIEVL